MTKLLIFAACAALASPASAQFTNCMTDANGTMTNCYTMPDMSQRNQRANDDGQVAAGAAIVQLLRGDPKKKAVKLLGKGDCEGAMKAAFSSGDLSFATQVRDYCRGR